MIQPQYLTISKLFQQNLFRIPEYQRMYSWTDRQRADLFEDIRTAADKNRDHFLATVVCLRRETVSIGTDVYQFYDVVDGQQRLTSLVIILNEIARKLNADDSEQRRDKDDIQALLVKPKKTQLLLQTNHDNSKIFSDYLFTATPPDGTSLSTEGDVNFVDAFNETEAFVTSWIEEGRSLTNLLTVVKNRLGVVFHSIDDEGAVYTVFEVLNSRGLDVDWLDKTKSMLMGIAYERYGDGIRMEKITELQKIWTKVYQEISKKKIPGHEVMRFAATLRDPDVTSRPLSATDAYDKIGEEARKAEDGEAILSKLILDVTDKLVYLHSEVSLAAVTSIAHARLLAVAIMLSTQIGKANKEKLLHLWEKVAFLVFGLHRKDARTGVGDYTRTAQRIFLGELANINEIEEAIKSIVTQGNDDLSVERAVQVLQAGSDCYTNWEEELRYLLMRYEEYLCKKSGEEINKDVWNKIWSQTASRTIEHILPQNPGPEWSGKLGRGQSQQKHVHRLGNLVLLPPGVNSALGNLGFADKRQTYKQQSLKHVQQIARKRDWNKQSIDEREKELFQWMTTAWADIS